MTALKDPAKPAHHIVETRKDTVLLNDGTELKRGDKNPWYVLMTMWGPQEGEVDWDLHERNRRTWNRWHCGHLPDADKQALIGKTGFAADQFERLSADELAEIKTRFQDRLGEGAKLPDADEYIDMSETSFSNTVVLEKLVLRTDAGFGSAQFHADAWFGSAQFHADAGFNSAQFQRGGRFSQAVFGGVAIFSGAEVQRVLWIDEAAFQTRFPDFDGTLLPDRVVVRAEQAGTIEMRDGYENTVEEDRVFWPDLPAEFDGMSKGEKDSARQSLEILRQAMAKQALPEAEHFFYRKEMWILARTGPRLGRVPHVVFEWLSDFGASVAIPTRNLIALWIMGLLPAYKYLAGLTPDAAAFGKAACWSLGNIFPYFGFQRLYFAEFIKDMPPLLKVFGGAQTILGFIFLFFLGLGLRTRFRLR